MNKSNRDFVIISLAVAQLLLMIYLFNLLKNYHDLPTIDQCMNFEVYADCNNYCGCQWCEFPESYVHLCLNSQNDVICKNGRLDSMTNSCLNEIDNLFGIRLIILILPITGLMTVYVGMKNK